MTEADYFDVVRAIRSKVSGIRFVPVTFVRTLLMDER
jgi:hypothetical protein